MVLHMLYLLISLRHIGLLLLSRWPSFLFWFIMFPVYRAVLHPSSSHFGKYVLLYLCPVLTFWLTFWKRSKLLFITSISAYWFILFRFWHCWCRNLVWVLWTSEERFLKWVKTASSSAENGMRDWMEIKVSRRKYRLKELHFLGNEYLGLWELKDKQYFQILRCCVAVHTH